MTFQAVLFDMDGVVVDTHQSVTRFWLDLASKYQVRLSQADFEENIHGCTASHTLGVLFPHLDRGQRQAVFDRLAVYEDNLVYRLVVQHDMETMRAVRDAIAREINAEAQGIASDLAEGLNERALETRRQKAVKLHDRISEYEGHLNDTLADLHATVKRVEEAATLATMQLMGV